MNDSGERSAAAGGAHPLGSTPDLAGDPRFTAAVDLFNAEAWYACHDGFEELWQEIMGPERVVLQALLQIAVAQFHLDRGNAHGAMVLMGEGLGRLAPFPEHTLGLDLTPLRARVSARLHCLQRNDDPGGLPLPRLVWLERPPAGRAAIAL